MLQNTVILGYVLQCVVMHCDVFVCVGMRCMCWCTLLGVGQVPLDGQSSIFFIKGKVVALYCSVLVCVGM